VFLLGLLGTTLIAGGIAWLFVNRDCDYARGIGCSGVAEMKALFVSGFASTAMATVRCAVRTERFSCPRGGGGVSIRLAPQQ
jgi:hypothetical protein